MKILLWVVLGFFSLIVASVFYLSLHDEYILIKQENSPDGTRLGIIIGNHGGGGPGYCRDLIYNFPILKKPTDISSEISNKEYLVKETTCDEVKDLKWQNNKLVFTNGI